MPRSWKARHLSFLALFVGCSGGGSNSQTTAETNPPPGGRVEPDAGAPSSPDPEGGSKPPPTPTDPGPPAIQFVGRFDTRDPDGPESAWPGGRIIARFEGTEVKVRLAELDADWMEGAPSEWDVAIDDVWQPKIVSAFGVHDYPIASGLPYGPHKVELYKRSEAQNGTTQFRGYDFGEGKLLPPPLRKTRRIEIIGDSAAAAFGIEGTAIGPNCPEPQHAAKWQNFHKSLGAILGDLEDAEVAGTVYSGKGIAKNIWHPDKETMPVIFARSSPADPSSTWDFSYVPQVVVIMMGGNDFAIGKPVDEGPATPEQFTAAYYDFVKTLRAKYPNAYLLLTISPSISDAEPPNHFTRTYVTQGVTSVASRRRAEGDTLIDTFAPVLATRAELVGCNGHGSPAFHERVAHELHAKIEAAKVQW